MDVQGNIQTEQFTFWMIQFRPCITYEQYQRQFTDAEQSFWNTKRYVSTGEESTGEEVESNAIFSNTCKTEAETQEWLSQHQLTLYGKHQYLSSDSDSRGIDKDIYHEQTATLFKASIGYKQISQPSFTDSAAIQFNQKYLQVQVDVAQNYVIETDIANQLFNHESWYGYLTPKVASMQTIDKEPGSTNLYKDTFKLDGRMTAGYAASIILSKSRTYDKSTYIVYGYLQFYYEIGGLIFMIWLIHMAISKIAGSCMQHENSKLLSRVYRQNANQTIDEERELRPTLSAQMQAIPAKPTLAERLAGGIRARLHEILSQQINTINTVNGFNEKFREASNMSEDKVTDNHSLYLYLTSSMLRKPKFNRVSCMKMCRWRFSS